MRTLQFFLVIYTLVILAIYGLILYYLYELQGKNCNCIMDWRHDFIKYFTMILGIFVILKMVLIIINKELKHPIITILAIIMTLASFVNVYAFYTYVGDIQEDKNCKCAGDKHPRLNSFMNILRYIYVVLFSINIVMLIIGLIMLMKTKM